MCSSGPLVGRLVVSCYADLFQLSWLQDRPQLQNYLAQRRVFLTEDHCQWQSVLSCTVVDDFRLTKEEADQLITNVDKHLPGHTLP